MGQVVLQLHFSRPTWGPILTTLEFKIIVRDFKNLPFTQFFMPQYKQGMHFSCKWQSILHVSKPEMGLHTVEILLRLYVTVTKARFCRYVTVTVQKPCASLREIFCNFEFPRYLVWSLPTFEVTNDFGLASTI